MTRNPENPRRQLARSTMKIWLRLDTREWVAIALVLLASPYHSICSQPPFTSVTAGPQHNLAVRSDGTVWAWGVNYSGDLGDGTTWDRNVPVQVSGLTGVIAAAAGSAHSLALKSDGTVWAWGDDSVGQLGDDFVSTHEWLPFRVDGLAGVVAVSAGAFHSLALKSDGTVWAWGLNDSGQLGAGTNSYFVSSPIKAKFLTGVISVSAGVHHSLALKSDGTVWAWGHNASGQLGDGTTADSRTPVQVRGLTGVVSVSAGTYHNLALKSDGTVWAWGYNSNGQLGDGTTSNRYAPVQVSGLIWVTGIAAGGDNNLAVESGVSVWAWGHNASGELGDGTTLDRHTPVQVGGLTRIKGMAAAGDDANEFNHSLAVELNGTLWAWGDNYFGELGDGTTTNRSTPVQIGVVSAGMSIWVDFSYSGTNSNGTFDQPYNTLAEGLKVVPNGETISIKAGATPATGTISKPVRIKAYGGVVTIGE